MERNTLVEKITTDYERSLVIPKDKNSKPFLLCPVGVVGAGKSTVTRPLSEMFSLVRISTDEIRQLFISTKETYEEDWVYEITQKLIKKYIALGYGIAIDANCANKRPLIEELSKHYALPIIWVFVNPPEEFVVTKLKKYPHGTLFKDVDEALGCYYRSKDALVTKGIPFVYTFDTSRDDIVDQVKEAYELIISFLHP